MFFDPPCRTPLPILVLDVVFWQASPKPKLCTKFDEPMLATGNNEKLEINIHHLRGNAIPAGPRSLERFWRNMVSLSLDSQVS